MTDWPVNLLDASVCAIVDQRVVQLRRPVGLLSNARAGDRLWIREPFHLAHHFDELATLQALRLHVGLPTFHFAADGPPPSWAGRRRFARELPKAMHRYHLALTEVRTERLQAVTDDDAQREGAADRADFRRLWDTVHMPTKRTITGDAARWSDNPLVTVLAFDLQERPLPQAESS